MTATQNPVDRLKEYFSNLPGITCLGAVNVKIGKSNWSGVKYHDANWEGDRLYLLGDLPNTYKRSSNTGYKNGDDVWYVACYYASREDHPASVKEFQSFGNNFILAIAKEIDFKNIASMEIELEQK